MSWIVFVLRFLKLNWRASLAVAIAGSVGLWLGILAGSGERANLALALAECARAETAAALEALDSQRRLAGENASRLERFSSRLSGAMLRAEQIGREPREIIYRVECLATDADLERLCRIAPDHPDCADQLR